MRCKILPVAFLFMITFCKAQDGDTPVTKKSNVSKDLNSQDKTNQQKEREENLKNSKSVWESMYMMEMGDFYLEALQIPETSIEDTFNPKRLYGPSQYDSRIEIIQLKSDIEWQHTIQTRSESVAIIIEKENLIKISPDTYQLNTALTLGERYKLCHGEAFSNQIVVGTGTAFIIDKNIMMTAAHVFQRPLKNYAVVFGYKVINSLGTAETGIAVRDVYFPVEITERYADLDIVKFKTDREIKRPVLQWEKSKDIKNGSEIYMLGYPMGLPEKLALNADVSDNSNFQYFYTSLDSFQGNSGSPVFNYETHKIIGVLVSGMTDYELRGDCYKTTFCRKPNCIGEKVIRIEMAFKN